MRLNVWNLYVGKNSFARGFFIEQNIICHDRSGFSFHESKLLMIKRHWSGIERLLHQSFLVSDFVTFPRNLPHVRKPYTTTFYQLIQCFNFNFDPTNDHNLLWFLDTHSLICHFIRKRDAPGEPRNADGKRTRYDPNVSSFCFYGVYLMGMKKKIVLQYFV